MVCKLRLSGMDELNSNTLFRNTNILKSVVFVVEPGKGFFNRREASFQFSEVIEGSNLSTFWCNLLQLENSNLSHLSSMAITLMHNQVSLPLHVLHPGLQLGLLESYVVNYESAPILMNTVFKSQTQSCCFYNHENFQNFCQNHPLLEVVKLGIGTGCKFTSPGDEP